MSHTGWGSHRWSGWPGAFCMLCGMSDPVEAQVANGDKDDFPYPDDLDNPTPEEEQACRDWWGSKNAEIENCPRNPKHVDPYTLSINGGCW